MLSDNSFDMAHNFLSLRHANYLVSNLFASIPTHTSCKLLVGSNFSYYIKCIALYNVGYQGVITFEEWIRVENRCWMFVASFHIIFFVKPSENKDKSNVWQATHHHQSYMQSCVCP